MEELEVYYQIITDEWKLFKKHYATRRRTADEWADIVRDMDGKLACYAGTAYQPFAVSVLRRLIEELQAVEERHEEKREGGKHESD